MRTELDEARLLYEHFTGVNPDIQAHWTSMQHVNWRRILLQYRKIKDLGIIYFDDIGNKKMVKKHKL